MTTTTAAPLTRTAPAEGTRALRGGGPARRGRASNVEALRIGAMLMIVGYHLVRHNALDVAAHGQSLSRMFLRVAVQPWGKVGVAVFFAISAWFMAGQAPTLCRTLRKSCRLEVELLFYSLGILALVRASAGHVATSLGVHSLFPTLTGLWWYPTSFIVFLIAAPVLDRGLRSVGQRDHGVLVVLILVAGGVVEALPYVRLGFGSSLVDFAAIYAVVSYCRWYESRFVTRRGWACGLLAGGVAATVLTSVLAELGASPLRGNEDVELLARPLGAPVLATALGLLFLVVQTPWRNTAVNVVASATFGVYLVSDHPNVRALLWRDVFDLSGVYGTAWLPAFVLGAVLAVFAACAAVDLARQGVFAGVRGAYRRARRHHRPSTKRATRLS